MAVKFVDMEKSPKEKDASRHNRRVKQFKDEAAAIEKKFAGRGTSGAAEAKKQIGKLAEKVFADMEMGVLYGLDAPKSRSYGQSTQPKQGKVKKAKGGMIGGKKRYMNGGMVMPGRGVRDTKMG
tara:strand:+ start:60 stop:431 length:372 start_codon:yes stop_codon:yes gene_type:complete